MANDKADGVWIAKLRMDAKALMKQDGRRIGNMLRPQGARLQRFAEGLASSARVSETQPN